MCAMGFPSVHLKYTCGSRFRRDEVNCCSHDRRNDYVDDSRVDSRSGVLRVDEGTSAAAGHITVEDRGTGVVLTLECRPMEHSKLQLPETIMNRWIKLVAHLLLVFTLYDVSVPESCLTEGLIIS